MSKWRTSQTQVQKFPRISAARPVRVSTVEPETDPLTGKAFYRSAEETTANLSRGGAFVRSWEPLAAGRRVILTLDLPEVGELQLVGRVAWTRRQLLPQGASADTAPGYGIEFAKGPSPELAALDRYLTKLAPNKPASPIRRVPTHPSPGI